MAGAVIGALLGFAFSGALAGAGIFSIFGMSIGTLWLVGASIGSLFDAPSLDIGGSTPNYAFGQLSNTKSQLLPIPIVYGRCRVGGNIFMQTFYDDSLQKMDMFVGVSEGPVQSIKSVYANDVVLIDENGDVVHELEESSLNIHLGAPGQVADSRDPGGNAYPNTAYIALTLKAQDGLSGNPVISSIVEGRKVWTPSGTVFSRNPAWIVYDFLTNTRYGVGIPTEYIDLDSFTAAADYCDHPIDGEPRFTLDYIIDVQRPAVDHLQAMLGCFRGYFLARDKIELHVEQAGSVYKVLGPDNFVKNSFTWWQKSGDDSPNRIVIEWIDPNNHYEQSSAPFEWTEDIAARGVYEKSISLLGVTRPEQVGRLGNYLLETARRVQNFCAFQVSTQDADIEAGEIISITYPDFTGWSAKPFRVLAVQDEGQTGNVTITCAEYDAAIYADDALTVDHPVIETPPVTTDDVYSLVLEDVGFLDEGKWTPVIRASWQNPSDYTPTALNVRWWYSGETDWNLSLNTTRLTTQARIEGLKSGETVQVWVNCVRPDTGKETTGKIASMVVGKDVTPPGACTGLAATGWFGSIILEWTNPADKDLNHIEVWENAIDNRATAVKIAETNGTSYHRYVGSFIARYYWVRGVDLSGNIGPWNADAGVYGNSDQETHQDFVDLLLEDNPYLNEAIADLNTGIGVVETGIADIRDIDIPDVTQRIADRMKEINAGVLDELAKVSDAVADALGNTYELDKKVRDAGIVVDPDDGTVRIWGLDQANGRISNVEIDLDAVESTLTSKVTLAEVDERIAGAVFGDAGELLLSGVDARISTVEETLDGVEAELLEKATYVEVDELGGRIGTAESRLNGHDAEIALLATSTELDAVEGRVTTAELSIDALEGSITQTIAASVNVTQDEEELIAQGLVDAMLNDQENKDETRERSRAALAIASTELYAHIDDGLNAEAGQRTLLAAQVAGNTSAIQTEATTRANADSAIASQITTLISDVGDNTADIQIEATTRANADDALSSIISTVSATANAKNKTYRQASAPTTGMTAGDLWFDSDANNKAYRYSGSSWVATDDTRIAQNTADIQTEQIARADGDSAVASQVTTLQTTTVGGTVTESASAPSSPTAGQVYYNTTSKKYFRWSGSAWVEVKGIEGHSRSAIQIINESVDGIKGKHAVKIDTNGYVTGYELIGTGASSSMVFHVENFLVGKPGTTNKYPFVIGTVDGVSRVSMDSALIQDASINNAKILNATIERLKMADGVEKGLSWGNSSFNSTSQTKRGSGSFTPTGASVSIATESKGRVMVNLFLSIQAWNSTVTIYLRKNGSTVQTLASYTGGSYDPYRTVFGFYLDSSPINDTSTYSLFVTYNGEAITIESCGGSVLAIYR